MERQLKQRVVGAALLVAFGVIFIPIFLDNDAVQTAVPPAVEIPPPPDDTATALPLDEPTIERLRAGIETPAVASGAPTAEPPSEPVPDLPTESPAPANPANGMETREAAIQGAVTTPAEATGKPPASAANTKPAEARAPIETTADGGAATTSATMSGWAIQLGSFASEANARRLLDKLRAAGYTAYLERHREAENTVFKVRVGPERQRADAEQLRERLEREFASKGILRPYR